MRGRRVSVRAIYVLIKLYGFDFGAIRHSVEEDRFACFEFYVISSSL